MAIKKMKLKKTGSGSAKGSVKYKTAKPTKKAAAIKSRKTKGTLKKASKKY